MEWICKTVEMHRLFFKSRKTLDIDFRMDALRKLQDMLCRYESRIYEAFWADLRKARLEVYATEIGMVQQEIKDHLRNLKKWARPTRVMTDVTNFYAASRIHHEPYGVVLIMSPWNYPLQLALTPLVGAISAGNCALLKPAHYSANVSALIQEMISEIFPPEYISVVTGDRRVNQAVLDQRFDLIFFTGSPALGKIVMGKAAGHLTPVVLELGGKSPCIVEQDANLEMAARRITFGKFLNAGQTCIAPDHLFVHRDVKSELVSKIRQCIHRFYGDDPEKSGDFARIINGSQFDRLVRLMRSAGTVIHGGRVNPDTRYIEPTLMDDITRNAPIMQEEIFGPILPILTFTDLEDVIAQINDHEKPLAMYFFTASDTKRDLLLSATSSGGGCINDTIMHIVNPRLPFGGVGHSGTGRYHGKYSFDTFSHHRSILQKTTAFNIPLPYPPYKDKLRVIKWIFSR